MLAKAEWNCWKFASDEVQVMHNYNLYHFVSAGIKLSAY